MKTNLMIPFDVYGNQLDESSSWATIIPEDYAHNYYDIQDGKRFGTRYYFLRPNYVFEQCLKITDYLRSGNSVGLKALGIETGTEYYMFISEFMKVMEVSIIENGITDKLKWTFRKQGYKYSVCLAGEEK